MHPTEEKPLILAAKGQKSSRLPAWFLRQAGRYLPEYQEVRRKMSFLELCFNPSMAAEVTLQPLRRFDLDAAIIFADILLIPEALGQKLSFKKDHGPVLSEPIRNGQDLHRLSFQDKDARLSLVGESISMVTQKLQPHQAMIGFAGAPFTVATYMIEGGSSKQFTHTKRFAFREAADFSQLLTLVAEQTYQYLKMQVQAGAEVLMLFDTWAGAFGRYDYERFVLPSLDWLCRELKNLEVPIIYFSGTGCDQLFSLGQLAVDVVAVDWRTPLTGAAKILDSVGLNCSLQGNLDPQTLVGDRDFVKDRVREVLREARKIGDRRHIFNVGHGLLPHTNPEALTWVLEVLRSEGL